MRNPWSILVWITASFVAPALSAQDRVFLFPSGSSNLVSVLRASDLAAEGSFQVSSAPFEVIESFDGSKYYLFTRRTVDSALVIDAATLEVTSTIDIGVSPLSAQMTPDGRFLLVAAAGLHVLDTTTDQPAVPPFDVGGQASKVIINDSSSKAYVLAQRGRRVTVINLRTLTVEQFLEGARIWDIALTSDDSRLLTVEEDGVRQYRTIDLDLIGLIPGNFPFSTATLHPLPDPIKLLVSAHGPAPGNTPQFMDLDAKTTRNVGKIGSDEFRNVEIIGNDRAYAVIDATEDLAEVDFTAKPDPTVTPLPFGANARRVDLSPNRRFAYVSSLRDATILRIDTSTNSVTATANTPVAPASHDTVYGPTPFPPAEISVNGGDNQFLPPDTTLPVDFAARVVDAQGNPVRDTEVLFEDVGELGLIFNPGPLVRTNTRGLAIVSVTIPPDPPETAAVSNENANQAPEEVLQQAFVTATVAGGLPPASFQLTIIRANGLVKVQGDEQITNEGQDFPLEFVLIATDRDGTPLPTGTPIQLAWSKGTCNATTILVDPQGFARFTCKGGAIPPLGGRLFLPGNVTASIVSSELGVLTATFKWNVTRSGTRLTIERVSPAAVMAPTGAMIEAPFQYILRSTFGAPDGGVAVTMSQLSGPPALITPRVDSARVNFVKDVFVTLGPQAGRIVLQAQASLPTLPAVIYTIVATGGIPVALETEGDGQSGKATNQLAAPLRVRVRNESGELVPFPEVTWRVVEGDATLEIGSDAQGSFALVTFGQRPGRIRIVAAIANLQTTFTLTSLSPEPAAIATFSGQNQTLTTSILSDPLAVRVTEADNSAAAAAAVIWSGPVAVRLHPVDGAPPGNPVEVLTNAEGIAAVRVELLAVAAVGAEGTSPSQLARTITVTASLGGQLATSFLLNVSGRTPQFEARGVVNAATFQNGIVPGSLITIFGTGLMEGVVGVESAAGATSFGGTTVRIGGVPSPLLTLAAGPPEQINLQAPFELIPGQNTTVEIENNGSRQTVGGIPVFSAQPGIFEIPLIAGGTVAAVIHATSGLLVSPDAPAEHGEALSMFFTGGGPLNPPVPTGTPGPLSPSVSTLPTIVGVDDKGAPVLFSGYAPGFLGLYQTNFTVPMDARCGLRPVNVRMGDTFSANSTLAIRCPQ